MTLPEESTEPAPLPEPDATQPDPAKAGVAQEAVPPKAPAPREPLHFIVVVLLVADIVFGLGLAVFAEKVLMFRPMAIMGCGLAALGLGVLAYFVLFGGGKGSRW
jgi:hypothetical protein